MGFPKTFLQGDAANEAEGTYQDDDEELSPLGRLTQKYNP
jgi:hypothetical protein